MRHASSAAIRARSMAAAASVAGNSTSQGPAIAVKHTAIKCAPRVSARNGFAGSTLAADFTGQNATGRGLETPSDLDEYRLQSGIEVEALQCARNRTVLLERLLVV